MAFHASFVPSTTATGIYDIGRSVALWVSALEILAHTGSQSGHLQVKDLVRSVRWKDGRQKMVRYPCGDKGDARGTLSDWLLDRVYKVRNDFLHGNPVEANALTLSDGGPRVFSFVGPLYRLALAAYLERSGPAGDEENGSVTDMEALADELSSAIDYSHMQERCEKALCTACEAAEAAMRQKVFGPWYPRVLDGP